MRLSRAVEDTAWALASQGRTLGRLYTGHGQEAIAVGAAYALGPDDVLAPMYRDMGAHLVRGVEPVEVFAQYFGKRDSATAGKDTGLHIGDMSRGIIGMISVLPDSLPVAVGAALAFKIRGERRVALTTFGEGAASTGAFHEAVNMAAVLNVPIVLLCENNGWALSTRARDEYGGPSIASRAPGYGIPGETVDGNDVEAVFGAVNKAVERARDGGGPTLLECVTMRMRGHSIIDGAEYVPAEQLAAWSERDPIAVQRARLEEAGLWDEQREAELDAAIEKSLSEAVRAAERMADPVPADAHAGVYAERPVPGRGPDAGGRATDE
ncbi:MAG: thiamine pyrophosphate-dependent dehydrogenase E1 component subunit alpha [Anaerolineae bacterium]